MKPLLPCLEFGSSTEDAEMTVILMHGLGADAHDFAGVAEALTSAAQPAKWRFVLPHAPHIPVTVNMGMEMPAWYDILDMSHPREVNWDTVAESTADVEAILNRESGGKTVLAGFSQGGAMALYTGLRNQPQIDGIFVMSGYLLEGDDHPCPEKEKDFPISIFHGDLDPVVPFTAAEQCAATLESKNYRPTCKIYEGLPHSVSDEEIQDVFSWLQEINH
ncbi:MAG: alpha/beta fold hydrolase [Verrucomicrobiales bacterium]|nr:alpha/beta fold hydrolase [Verrucomicrobiales bacterium]